MRSIDTPGRVTAAAPSLAEGMLLAGRYRVDERLAAGGMGVVHRGWDHRLARPVALKLLHPHLAAEPEVERRFRSEARHAARVKHRNVVVLLDQDDHEGVPFIVMELVRGATLRALLRRRGRLPAAEVVDLLAGACAGLSAVHATGLVHRDVKPENLLIDARGVLRVTDFGIASALDASRHTPDGVLLGSVTYVAPEIVLGRSATAASDQYALGIVVFEALTGTTPLAADDPAAVAVRHAREAVPPPSSVDRGIGTALDAVVTTATALDPADRYPTLDALLAAARAAVAVAPRATPGAAVTTMPRATSSAARTALRRLAPLTPAPPTTAPPTSARPSATPPARRPPAMPARGSTAAPAQARPPTARPPAAPPSAARPPAAPAQARPPTARPPTAPARARERARRATSGVVRPARERPISALAVSALVFSLFDGFGGLVLAPALGWLAARRILRRPGRLGGETLAYAAMGIAALRLLALLATRAA